jgi:membrane-associated phospholipid phosphatase
MASVSLKSALALALLGSAAFAAPPPPPGAPAPAPKTASNQSPAPTSTSAPVASTPATSDAQKGDEPDIATPAPDAPPAKVEEAKEVAEEAKLTPIIPNIDGARPAFLLYAEIDIPILAVGTVFALARRTKTEPAFCAPMCDRVGVNSLDRLTAGFYSAGWSTLSDYTLLGIGVGGAALLLADEGILGTLNDAVVIGEAALSATAVASIMTLAAGRPRPFLYGDPADPGSAPLSLRNSANASLSFLSGHTTQAFALVTSVYVAQRRLHPNSRRPEVVLGVGLAAASLVAVSRVMAGYHFITDVAGGAVVGSSLGLLVTSVHGSPVEVVPVVNETPNGRQVGVGVSGTF